MTAAFVENADRSWDENCSTNETTTRKPQDATLRNIRAAKRREQATAAAAKSRLTGHVLALLHRIEGLERRIAQLEAK